MVPEHHHQSDRRTSSDDDENPKRKFLEANLDDAKKKEPHGQFGHGVPQYRERVGHIRPEDGVGGVVEVETPEAFTQPIIDRNMECGCEGDEGEARQYKQIVLCPNKSDDADPSVKSQSHQAE